MPRPLDGRAARRDQAAARGEPGRRADQRRRRGGRQGRQGRLHRRRADDRRHLHAEAVRRDRDLRGAAAGRAGRDRARRVDRRQGGLRGRRRGDGRRRRPEEAVQARRPRDDSASRPGSAARRSSSSTSPTAQALFDKPNQVDFAFVAGQARRLRRRRSSASVASILPPTAQVRTAAQEADKARRRHPRGPLVPDHRPARVRVHRRAGRRVPDLQHVLDHRRPARARAGAAAHARRDAPAGARPRCCSRR